MTPRRITLCTALAVAVASCTGADDPEGAPTTIESAVSTSTTATAPERQASTTTTAFDPETIEGQVEAAYLKSWDVYADAVYDLELDEQALREVFAGEALDLRRDEVRRRIREGRASLVRIDHNYQLAAVDETTVNVVDHFLNHQVLIDPSTRKPIEEDPNDRLLVNFKMQLVDGEWRVVFIQKATG